MQNQHFRSLLRSTILMLDSTQKYVTGTCDKFTNYSQIYPGKKPASFRVFFTYIYRKNIVRKHIKMKTIRSLQSCAVLLVLCTTVFLLTRHWKWSTLITLLDLESNLDRAVMFWTDDVHLISIWWFRTSVPTINGCRWVLLWLHWICIDYNFYQFLCTENTCICIDFYNYHINT